MEEGAEQRCSGTSWGTPAAGGTVAEEGTRSEPEEWESSLG